MSESGFVNHPSNGVSILEFNETRHREGVIRLWREVFGYETAHNDPGLAIDRKMVVPDGLFFVATVSGEHRVIGSVMAGYDGHRGWIYSLAVQPGFRGTGIGGRLMKKAEESLIALGCLKINLQVVAGNEGVVAFYEQLGYSVEPRISMGKRMLENLPPPI